jgi:energy-coupling factor transport system ATP-binding protein
MGPPRLLVLDEPDNGLDAKRADALVVLLRAHATAGHAAIVATHDAAMLDALGARRLALAISESGGTSSRPR